MPAPPRMQLGPVGALIGQVLPLHAYTGHRGTAAASVRTGSAAVCRGAAQER